MSDSTEPTPIDPWPLILRVLHRAQAISATDKRPFAAVRLSEQILLIPKTRIGVASTVLFIWTPTSIRRGVTVPDLDALQAEFTRAILSGLPIDAPVRDELPEPVLPFHPEELIL